MSAPAKLDSSSDGQFPLFYPGQVLSDAALAGIATFARSGLAAESQRHGWGIIYGIFPSAEADADSVTVSRGMVSDQNGRLFVLDKPATRKLTALLSDVEEAAAAESGEAGIFDLWLSIGVEKVGHRLPFRKIGLEAGFAPVVEPPACPDYSHPPHENLIANLELRAVSRLEKYLDDEAEIVRKFKAEFNKAANWNSETPYQETLGNIHTCRAEALTKLYSLPQVEYNGIPLGRVVVKKSREGRWVVAEVDCGLARREQAPPRLASKPNHINSAALFGLKRDEAVTWLAHNGFPRWTIESLTEKSVRQQMTEDQEFLSWDVELRAGTTAKLYTNEGRIVLVKQGPTIEDEFKDLLCRIASLRSELRLLRNALALLLLLLLIIGALVFIYYH